MFQYELVLWDILKDFAGITMSALCTMVQDRGSWRRFVKDCAEWSAMTKPSEHGVWTSMEHSNSL